MSFDVRGIILLRARSKDAVSENGSVLKADPDDPLSVTDIPIGSVCQRLHFLQCSISTRLPSTREVGAYVIHYADGQVVRVPLTEGREISDRHRTGWKTLGGALPPAGPGRCIAWDGQDAWSRKTPMGHTCVDLFTWENPRRGVQIQSLDIVSNADDAGMCTFAITMEGI